MSLRSRSTKATAMPSRMTSAPLSSSHSSTMSTSMIQRSTLSQTAHTAKSRFTTLRSESSDQSQSSGEQNAQITRQVNRLYNPPRRLDRETPVRNLLSLLSFSYLARTSATSSELEGVSDAQTRRNEANKQKNTESDEFDDIGSDSGFESPEARRQRQIQAIADHPVVISTEAVAKTIDNTLTQNGYSSSQLGQMAYSHPTHISQLIAKVQSGLYKELDGILDFANLHYNDVVRVIQNHSIAKIYNPEVLAIEFFDYRLELFNDVLRDEINHFHILRNQYHETFSEDPTAIENVRLRDIPEVTSRYLKGNSLTQTNIAPEYLNMNHTIDEEILFLETTLRHLTEETFSIHDLRRALQVVSNRYPDLNVPIDDYLRQMSFEHQAVSRAAEKYAELADNLTRLGLGSTLSSVQDYIVKWFKPFAVSLEQELYEELHKKEEDDGEPGSGKKSDTSQIDKQLYYPYLRAIPPAELACIALHETLGRALNAPDGVRIIDLALTIGRCVNTEVNLQRLRADKQNWLRIRKYYPGNKLNEQVIRRATLRNALNQQDDPENNGMSPTPQDIEWSEVVRAKVGSILLKTMIRTASVSDELNLSTPDQKSSDADLKRVETPAFRFEMRWIGPSSVGYLTCHKKVQDAVMRGAKDVNALTVRLMPMVIPPKPWRSSRDGGYLSVPTSIIRTKGSRKQAHAVSLSNIPDVYSSLNSLGRVPWVINRQLLDIIQEGWNDGGAIADMPSRRDIPIPSQPELSLLKWDAEKNRYVQPTADTFDPQELELQNKAWKQWQRDVQTIAQNNADLHSLRCDMQLKLNQAKQLEHETVYFPLNLDFRGRAYPLPPHLNHLGSDLARALLQFKEKRPLGPKGLYWLKAHLAAQFGVDKVSFDDRVKFSDENYNLIVESVHSPYKSNVPNPHFGKKRSVDDSPFIIPKEIQHKYARVYIRQQMDEQSSELEKTKVRDMLLQTYRDNGIDLDMSIQDDPSECTLPLDGNYDVRPRIPWWQTADSPWQALATCHEIISAIESGNPEKYECGLPVHQDGSCNGLQHYAALGRDAIGGSRVNLTKSDKPQDVYTHVLNEVKKRMMDDIAENDNPLAKMLLPHMSRKIVKQTVMTSVYGVTFIGAREQILRQLRELKDIDWTMSADFVQKQREESRQKYLDKMQEKQKRKANAAKSSSFHSDQTDSEHSDVDHLQDQVLKEMFRKGESPTPDPSQKTHKEGDYDVDDQGDIIFKGEQDQQFRQSLEQQKASNEASVELDEASLLNKRQQQEEAIRASSIYLARLTLASLGSVFTGATQIMDWLSTCAKTISTTQQPVSWITPLRLPVVQHYRLVSKYQVKTLQQTLTFTDNNDLLPVSGPRQRAAFPPNFVHSLDATHMMLTANQCAQRGIVFSSVHDSFWTHPADVDTMNTILRDQFINLYKLPILNDLHQSFLTRYPSCTFPEPPKPGDLDLDEVRKSPYFFN